MDFLLNDDQKQIVAMVRELAKEKVAPHAARWDAEERFPTELVEVFAEVGLLGLAVPEEYGGLGADLLTRVLVIEEMAKVDASAALLHRGAGFGHDAHRRRRQRRAEGAVAA